MGYVPIIVQPLTGQPSRDFESEVDGDVSVDGCVPSHPWGTDGIWFEARVRDDSQSVRAPRCPSPLGTVVNVTEVFRQAQLRRRGV